jgi:hypothetical protein
MTDDNGTTVPPSRMGIGDDEVEAQLEHYAEQLNELEHVVVDAEVKNDILAGVAHIKVELSATQGNIPGDLQNWIIANDLMLFDPEREQKHDQKEGLTFRLTLREIYVTWGAMDAPEW